MKYVPSDVDVFLVSVMVVLQARLYPKAVTWARMVVAARFVGHGGVR